jgi:hypothetical protein
VSSNPLKLAVSLALVLGLSGCDFWPLYEHLPDPERVRTPLPTVELVESLTSSSEGGQPLGEIEQGQAFLIRGRVDACGFVSDADGPAWPAHPVDTDGDGFAESARAREGWYSGDVDRYQLTAVLAARITAELWWEQAPTGPENAPYRPDVVDGAWSSESDLDLFFQTLPQTTDNAEVLVDTGVSRNHPESLPAGVVLSAGETVVVGVACHHELATDYELRLWVRPL